MSEHRIRLRGPWEALDLDEPSSEPFRLSLPIEKLDGDAPRRLRLVRKFGRPRSTRTAADDEPLKLVFEDVDGLSAMFLNDEPLAWRSSAAGALIADLPPLRERNTLRLEAEIGPLIPEQSSGWGKVAIAIPERG